MPPRRRRQIYIVLRPLSGKRFYHKLRALCVSVVIALSLLTIPLALSLQLEPLRLMALLTTPEH
jgi:hypothetical protein